MQPYSKASFVTVRVIGAWLLLKQYIVTPQTGEGVKQDTTAQLRSKG